ncbi:hypothetical protein [Pseudobdellovibrio exovorus]|uniref:Uncharacterized protein n=1 Tax=Pseudobdellovibrio exovorus JSS TaxID=1184267 RepID=M4V815_9BACT|nr:hypothetical protein [Pseudobdellovibrio exovorus]AGH94580.1 hypothetical protein A11Q_360 [Pseudobdellovibrio exovorus JSS]
MRKKSVKKKSLKSKKVASSIKAAQDELPVQVRRIQSILSEKAVDIALPITKMLQAKLSLLESKLNRV